MWATATAFLVAILKLVVALVAYAKDREAKQSDRLALVAVILSQITKDVELAKNSEIDLRNALRLDPDRLLRDDGFKRKTNHIRDGTDTD
jgi:hypothetical protein